MIFNEDSSRRWSLKSLQWNRCSPQSKATSKGKWLWITACDIQSECDQRGPQLPARIRLILDHCVLDLVRSSGSIYFVIAQFASSLSESFHIVHTDHRRAICRPEADLGERQIECFGEFRWPWSWWWVMLMSIMQFERLEVCKWSWLADWMSEVSWTGWSWLVDAEMKTF